jgi:hypothetical protein
VLLLPLELVPVKIVVNVTRSACLFLFINNKRNCSRERSRVEIGGGLEHIEILKMNKKEKKYK